MLSGLISSGFAGTQFWSAPSLFGTGDALYTMPPNQGVQVDLSYLQDDGGGSGRSGKIRCALLGCGMMGQEHTSYLMGYSSDVRIDYLCDPHEASVRNCLRVMKEFDSDALVDDRPPVQLSDEDELLKHADEIDLLVIASPNYLHTDQLLRWGKHDLNILVEKPVAVSKEQHDRLRKFSESDECKARIWVAMEYRYIPAVTKLLSLLPTIGDVSLPSLGAPALCCTDTDTLSRAFSSFPLPRSTLATD